MATSWDMRFGAQARNKTTGQRGRGQGRGWGRGHGRSLHGERGMGIPHQGPLGVNRNPSSYKIAKFLKSRTSQWSFVTVLGIKSFSRAKDSFWRHDLFNGSMSAVGLSGVETGTKLYISNLDYGVSNEDIKELFSEIGQLKHCAVHYQRDGRSSGSAEVIFMRKSDALKALKRYNNVHLDGKPMKIEVVGANLGLPVTPRISVAGGGNNRGRRTVVMTPAFGRVGSGSSNYNSGRYGVPQRGRGGRGNGPSRDRGRGRGRGQGRSSARWQKVEKSAAELDKELETYHSGAMDTS